MLSEVHSALQRLVQNRGLIDADDVDVAFDAPTKLWTNALTRPTISFFLFDVNENTELRRTAMETARGNGVGIHRMPPRRFDLHYLVSALTTDVADEHLLLWRALATLLKYPTLPDDVLSAPLREPGLPIVAKVGKADDGPRPLDLWSALEVRPRPALTYVVTVPLDLEVAIESPLVLTRTTRYRRMADPVSAADHRRQIGGVVRDRAGERVAGAAVSVEGRAAADVLTNADGEFTVGGVPAGEVTLRVERAGEEAPTLATVRVPSASYDVVLD
jgi:hypothetical protein